MPAMPAGNAESEHPPPGAHAPGVFCPSGAHKIFIAKMKRESDHTSRDAGSLLLALTFSRQP